MHGLIKDHPIDDGGFDFASDALFVCLQRCEQYLTSSHTATHFLRHAKGRLHARQILVGRSAFCRILAMTSPRNVLATPIIKTTIRTFIEPIDNLKKMACGLIGTVHVQSLC